MVLRRAQALGFLGPGPVEPHLEHAAAFAAVDPPARALDLGAGGGLPGLPLALRWPDSMWVLLDAQQRRGAFLVEVVGELGLAARVDVVVERAEVAARDPRLRGTFALVTARSFGPPAVTAECAAGFLSVGGALVVSEPPHDEPGRWSSSGLADLGLRDEGRHGKVRVLHQVTAVGERFPRRVGVPAKRPLWR